MTTISLKMLNVFAPISIKKFLYLYYAISIFLLKYFVKLFQLDFWILNTSELKYEKRGYF